jgi:hypothetical protein
LAIARSVVQPSCAQPENSHVSDDYSDTLLEHFDLEDAFGRRPHPSLSLEPDLVPRTGEDPHEDLWFSMRNEGRGIARYIGIICMFSADVTVVSTGYGWHNVTNINKGKPGVSYTDNVGVIHAVAVVTNLGNITIQRADKGTPLSLSLSWYCEGMVQKTFSGTVAPEVAPG